MQREIGSEPDGANAHNQDASVTNENAEEDAQFLLDNLGEEVDYYSVSPYIEELVAMSISKRATIDSNILLLDSCSTINLVSNKDLLHDIHEVPVGMRVQCNAGTIMTNLKGSLGEFPEPVWYYPRGVVNILSMRSVSRHYHVQYDNERGKYFSVTRPNGITVKFEPTKKGLYACNTTAGQASAEAWMFLNLTEDRKQEYTKREYRDAI